MKSADIKELYKVRFAGERELESRNAIWRVLCGSFFSKYISPDDKVLDIGSGYCEFLNNIKASKKTGIDINPETKKFALDDVEIMNIDCANMESIRNGSYDAVFSSNFLEHLTDKEEVLKTLKEANRILVPGGRLILLGPNIKYLYSKYWDFFDHKVPLSHLSLKEILISIGFEEEKIYGKFLPFTTKSRLPKSSIFIRIYLSLPLLYRIFGKQFLIIVRKRADD